MKKNPNIDYISKVENVSMEDEWYEIADSSHFWFDWRINAFLKQVEYLGLSKSHPYKVIEIGCGEGILRKSIEKETNWIVDAADLNIAALEKVSPGKGKILLYNIFDEDDSLIDSYDIVILFDVLEHIEDTQEFIFSFLKHLKPGGYAFINVPALNSFYSVYDKYMGHYRRYDKNSLIKEFDQEYLKILDIRYWGFFLLPVLAIRYCLLFFKDSADRKSIINSGFKPPSNFINNILKLTSRMELFLFNRPISGSSLLLAGKKTIE